MFELRVTKMEPSEDSNVIGLASMTVDGKFAFNSMRVIESKNTERGFFVSMPSYKTKDGNYVDFFNPITAEMTDAIASAVAKAMETNAPVTIGEGETKISSYVTPTHFPNNPTQVGTAHLRCGDFVCNTIAIRKSAENNVFVSYPSYLSKKVDENGEQKRFSYCNPITAEFRTLLSDDLIDKYNTTVSKNYEVKSKVAEPSAVTVHIPDPAKSM